MKYLFWIMKWEIAYWLHDQVRPCLGSGSSPVLQFPVMARTWLGLLKFWRACVKRGMVLSLYQLSAHHSRSRESSASGGNINERCQVTELDISLPVTVPAQHQGWGWGETSSALQTGERKVYRSIDIWNSSSHFDFSFNFPQSNPSGGREELPS